MKRREFIALVGGAAVNVPLLARAQQQPERIARIGYLTLIPPARMRVFDDAFREGLRDLGYVEGKNIRIELQTAATIPAVRGDPNQLLQVFFNIINNAVDAMEEVGGGTLTVRTLSERENVVVTFSDTGPGVSEPRLVFDPFYTTKPVGKGTGLGLSICYGIIHDHGGQISCYNRAEGGATFRIELPAVPTLFAPRMFSTHPRGTPAKLS